jgi:tripartite ATP-independent transporter DctP family solute receptor
MKRILCAILTLSMLLTLSACGSSGDSGTPGATSDAASDSASTSAGSEASAIESDPALVASEVDVDNASTEGTEITLSLNHVGATTHPYQYGMAKFAQLVTAYTDGTVGVTVYPASQIASGAKAVEFVQMGTLDMCLESTMALENFVPEVGVLNLPFLFTTKEQCYTVLDGPVGDEIKAMAEQYGFKILAWMDNGFRDITNSVRPITGPDDLKGIKLRTPESAVFLDTFTQLGATPTAMATSELFSALQLGTVEGQENAPSTTVNNKYHEILKYYSVTHHIYTAEPLIISLDKWNSLSADQQAAMQLAANEACAYEREKSDESVDINMKIVIDSGMEVNELSDESVAAFQEACKPIYEKYQSNYGDMISKIQDAVKQS